MARREFVGGAARTTLSSSINDSTLTIPITSGTNWPTGAANNFVISIDRGQAGEEKILCSSRSGNTITASQRGYDGTTASAHNSGVYVEHVISAEAMDDLMDHVYDVTRDDHTQYARKALVTAKGDLLAATASGTLDRLAVGANDTVLVADSAQSTGVKWSTPVYVRRHTTLTAAVTAISTTATTTLFTTSILANTLGTLGILHVRCGGYISNNSGSSVNYTFVLNFGTSGSLSFPTAAVATSAQYRAWMLDAEIHNVNSASAQSWSARLVVSSAATITGPPGGAGVDDATALAYTGWLTSTEATTSNKTLALTGAMGTAHASAALNITHGTVTVTGT